ncbi:Hypothetical predicted protein [Scomber scombrus]|uniref:Uncharacterized protein n=1 Tax=Scomber scombrus TaxID=13677 RepID=A0AAV1Q4Z3_SCOSC
MEAKLGALQCHFTWDLDPSRSKLFCLRDKLDDIGTEEGNSWLGHIYNLQGYIHYQLGFTEDAQCFFSRAAEAFRLIRRSDEGPWLVVNYGNLAWWHYQLGEQADSQSYLSKVDTLLKEYPSPSEDELHPEIYAEKAWTLMNFGKPHLATDYFQRAIRMQPDMVEWHTSHTIALVNVYGHPDEQLKIDNMKIAKENDPDNLYLAALYLQECAKEVRKSEDEVRELAKRVLRKSTNRYSGIRPDEVCELAEKVLSNPPNRYSGIRPDEVCELAEKVLKTPPSSFSGIRPDEVRELAEKVLKKPRSSSSGIRPDEERELAEEVLKKPPSSYSGIRPLLRLYRIYISLDEAVDLAEEALKRHPDERHLKYSAAICYKWRVYSNKHKPLEQEKIDRAISLHEEMISLYPDSSLKVKIALANIHARSNHGQAEADKIYQELLASDL